MNNHVCMSFLFICFFLVSQNSEMLKIYNNQLHSLNALNVS